MRIAVPGQPKGLFGRSVYSSIHDNIMPSKKSITLKLAPDVCQVYSIKEVCLILTSPKLSNPINKNAIVAEYDASCQKCGIKDIVSTTKKGEQTTIPIIYPSITELVRGCLMKPSLNHQYRVLDLCLDNVIVKLIKSSGSFPTNEDIMSLSEVNSLYQEMTHDVTNLRMIDFTRLREPRIGYAEQTEIDPI